MRLPTATKRSFSSDDDSEEEALPYVDLPDEADDSDTDEEGEVKREMVAPRLRAPLIGLSSPSLQRLPGMSNSQYTRLTDVVSQLESASSAGRDALTRTQVHRLQVTLENLHEVRNTITQMIEIHLEDEEVSSNLFAVLDYIDQAQAVQQLLAEPEDSLQETKRETPTDHEEARMSDMRNALSISQLLANEVDSEADLEFARKLQLEFDLELIQNEDNAEAFAALLRGEEPRPPIVISKEVVSLRSQEEGSLKVNPFTPLTGEANHSLQSVFSDVSVEFQAASDIPALSSIQYVEVTVSHVHKDFQPPFAVTLWEKCNDISTLEFSYPLLERLSPFSGALLQAPGVLKNSIQGEGIKEGDVVGIGFIPQGGADFVCFLTRNGSWMGHMNYTLQNPHSESLRVVLITGNVSQIPQLDVAINDGSSESNPFRFSFTDLEVEDCSVCYEDVLCDCVQVIESCSHRFCSKCVTSYLEAALESGEVLDTKCPDNSCEQLLTDNDLGKALSLIQFGKFKQFRTLAKLRLEPNCRWCPNETCQSGVIADLESPSLPKLECGDCGTEFCFECSDRWHPRMSCQRYARQKEKSCSKQETKRKKKEEEGTRKWMKENKTIKCTRCRALVQRKEGCNHMTCNCGHEFCWLCGETIISVVGSHSYPLHYSTGACAGLQMSHKDELSTGRRIVRGALAPIRFGVTLPLAGLQRLIR